MNYEEQLEFYKKELEKKDSELRKYAESDYMFLQAVSAHFVCLVYVNLETGKQVRIVDKDGEVYEEKIDVPWDDYIGNVMSCIRDERKRNRISNIAKLENFRKMKTGEKIEFDYYTNYRSKTKEYYYAHTFIKAVNRDGVPFVVVYTTKNDELDYVRQKADKMADQARKLNKALDIESQYKESFLSGAEAVYYINLTKDELEMAYYYDDNRNACMLGKSMGLEIPCKYSEYVNEVMKLLPEERAKQFYASSSGEMIVSRIKNDQMYYCFDYEGKARNGMTRWYRNSYLAANNSENDELYCMITIQDITDARKLEEDYKIKLINARDEAQMASRAKSAFLFNVSHDIRTPMNAILGFVSLAKKNCDEKEKMMEYLDKVEVAGNHLLNLINDVLSMARVESGKQEIENKPHTLSIHINEQLEILRTDAVKKQIELTQHVDIINDYVYCDSLRLYQIMLNLISNAIKYTEPGGKITYDVKELKSDKEGYAKIRFIVKDTGIGMTEDFVANVFEAFSRERTSTESGIEGTGLGLAITKQLVELMGGTIEVSSELGVGSEFVVIIDFKIANKEEVVDTDSEISDCNLNGVKILLVEDNELNREIAYECLTEWGMIVEMAENGQVAVDMIEMNESDRYDAILMDVQMPVLDGYRATRKIRKLDNPVKASIPIIAMTANAFEEDRQTALAMGMNDHIAKPVVIEKLLGALQRVIYNK